MKFIELYGYDYERHIHIRPEQIVIVEDPLFDQEWIDKHFRNDDDKDDKIDEAAMQGDDYGCAKLTLANGSTMFVGHSVNEILELLNSDHE